MRLSIARRRCGAEDAAAVAAEEYSLRVIPSAGAGGQGQFRTPSGRAALAATGPAPSGATSRTEGEMPAGITSNDSMFSVRETPWHGLGAVLDHAPTTIAEAIEASGLAWRVEREPIAVDRGDAATVDDWWEPRCEEIPGFYATVRQDTRQVLGIVGERYRIYLQLRVMSSSGAAPLPLIEPGRLRGGLLLSGSRCLLSSAQLASDSEHPRAGGSVRLYKSMAGPFLVACECLPPVHVRLGVFLPPPLQVHRGADGVAPL